jgi:hypothetical protein
VNLAERLPIGASVQANRFVANYCPEFHVAVGSPWIQQEKYDGREQDGLENIPEIGFLESDVLDCRYHCNP